MEAEFEREVLDRLIKIEGKLDGYNNAKIKTYENEKEINYTVEELDVENGYNVTYNTETARKVLITNTHTPEKTK